MKAVSLVVASLAVTFVNSCTTYYYVSTYIADDMSVRRSVYMSSDVGNKVDTDHTFVVDFYDTSEHLRHVTDRNAADIASAALWDHDVSNPLFRPVESLERRFRWFYTYFDYEAVFAGIKDMLPLPYDGYLTDEQLELFFRGDDPPEGWNGVEMYYLLDDISQKFAKWYSDASYGVMCDIFKPFCSKGQLLALDTLKTLFMESSEREALFAMRPDEFEDKLASIAPGAGFGRVYEDNKARIDAAYEQESEIISYFEASFVYVLDMPGKYIRGNADRIMDGSPSWKVDAYRLMAGDMVLEATSRKVNFWAFILTFAAIALLLQVFARVFTKS